MTERLDRIEKMLDKVSLGLDKLLISQKETSEQMRKTDEQMKETREQMKKSRKEVDKEMKETREQMKKSRKEADKEMKEIREQIQRNDWKYNITKKQLRRLEKIMDGMWMTQWEISENLIYDNFWNVFKGIWEEINTVNRNVKLYNKWRVRWEFDIVWINGTKIFIWETKTKLTKDHIDKLITKTIPIFRKYDKKHEWMEIYGVIWARVISEEVLKYACDKWLYVLKEKNNGNAEMVDKSIKTVQSL